MLHVLRKNQQKSAGTQNNEILEKSVDILEQFLKITILTSTYEAAQEFFQNKKDELEVELSELNLRGNCTKPYQNLLWQRVPYLLKWKFFDETFTPVNEECKQQTLIRIAQRIIYAKEEKPIVLQDRQEMLLELMSHLNTVVRPAEALIDKHDAR